MNLHFLAIPSSFSVSQKTLRARGRRLVPGSLVLLAALLPALFLSGCHVLHCASPVNKGSDWISPGGFFSAQTVAPGQREGDYADSLYEAQEEKPGVGDYVLYTFVGVPRDVVALVLEPAGYTVGAVVGVALNIVAIPLSALYSGEYKVPRPLARGCVMAPAFPFFFLSDLLCRSFTGDMNRYRWGVHPFPRADHRFFPNYSAILGD